jgi:opacity protein-like surface antigen
MTMLRKLSLVAVAAASLGVAALAPTSASAWGGWHGGWHHGWGWGGPHFYVGGPAYYGPAYSYGYGGCYVRRLAPTPWGPRWRLVNRCY